MNKYDVMQLKKGEGDIDYLSVACIKGQTLVRICFKLFLQKFVVWFVEHWFSTCLLHVNLLVLEQTTSFAHRTKSDMSMLFVVKIILKKTIKHFISATF